MPLSAEKKYEIVKEYRRNDSDTGSPEVQIALLTHNINTLQDHFRDHPGDHHSRRGLQIMVARRRKLLDYLRSNKLDRYTTLLGQLGLRR